MLLSNHRFDHGIKDNPLENSRILEKMNFQLMAQNQGENRVKEIEFDHVQRACQDHEGLT